HVGSILERGFTGDVLRARLACKHWHSCLTRNVTRLTLYAGAVPLPTVRTSVVKCQPPQERSAQTRAQELQEQHQYQHQHQHPIAKPAQTLTTTSTRQSSGAPLAQSYSRHVHLIPSFAPTVRHVTIHGQTCDLNGLRLLAHSLPSLTSLSLAISATYTATPPPQLQPMQPALSTKASDPDAASRTLTAGSSSQAPLPATAASSPADTDAAPSSAMAEAAAACSEYPSPTEGRWPPAPPLLEKLWIQVHDDVPPDVLRHLLLQSPASDTASPLPPPPQLKQQQQEQQQQQVLALKDTSMTCFLTSESGALEVAERGCGGTNIRPRGEGEACLARTPPQWCWPGAVLPLRELGLLPRLDADSCSAASDRLPAVPFIDLSPLLDPRLAGVTHLIVPPMTNRRREPPQSPPPQQQQPHGGEVDLWQLDWDAPPAMFRMQQVVGRLTQLRSLTVLEQVELLDYRHCLSALTNLRALHLPKGVFCEYATDLRHLMTLSLLETLELNFTIEWWIYAADLCVLSSLAHLRHLKLAVDYGLDVTCAPMPDLDEDDADMNELAAWYEPDDIPDPDLISASVMHLHRRDPAAAAAAYAATATNSAVGGSGGGGSGGGGRERLDTEEDVARALAAAWGCARGVERRALCSKENDPGDGDDWRVPLGCLTQLRRLELRLVNGGGRHLAEAMCAARWLTGGQRRPVGGDDGVASADDHETGEGASLTLQDAPAAAFLDVPYWYKMATGAAAGDTADASLEASFMQLPRPHNTPWPRRVFLAPPLVSLHLGAGRWLQLMHAHILCLGLMTHLRSLELSFVVVTPSSAASPHECTTAEPKDESESRCCSGNGIESYTRNPLLVLKRLRSLRELRIRTKQLWSAADVLLSLGGDGSDSMASEGSSSDGGDGRALLDVSAPMDDGIVQAWLEGMPLLHTLALRGVGWLGDRALTALGRHSSLRSLELWLKVPPVLPSYATDKRQFAERSSTSPRGIDNGGSRGPGGGAQGMSRIGYGSYYGLRTAFTGCGGASGSGVVTPLGSSPPGPGNQLPGLNSPGWADPAAHLDRAIGGKTDGSMPALAPAGGVGTFGSAERMSLPELARDRVATRSGDAGAWREKLLARGIEGRPEMLADVPYFVRPHHLPPSLAYLDLTNAAFSAEWAYVGNSSGAAFAQLPFCGGATSTGSSHVDGADGRTLSDPWDGTARPVPRLVSLKLVRRPPKYRRLLGRDTAGDAAPGAAPAAAASILDPTRLTDWHLVFLTACQPTLAHLQLHDTDAGSGAGDAAKLHYRALAHLGSQLSCLESLTLRVGNRLRWRAQEALFCSLPEGLRRLHLYAAHMYCEAVAMATRLVHLSSLKVIGYTDPAYVEALFAAGEEVSQHLPACSVLLWHRDVDDLPEQDHL
ncbi:hypothetical protein Vretimale_18415, partial [Volvox reticuliferus]